MNNPRYLLDTNTVSYIIRGKNEMVFRRLREIPGEQIFISVITEAELRFVVARRPEATNIAAAVAEFLRRVQIVPWDSLAALHYAEVRSASERIGEPMAVMDLLIAAQALALNATLVTSDRGFRRIKRLKIADWTKP